MPGLPGDLRRLCNQDDGAARHQQDEGGAGKQGGGARPDAGDEDASGEGSANGDGKHAQHSSKRRRQWRRLAGVPQAK